MSMTKAAVVATTSSTSCLVAGVYLGYVWTKRRITEHYEAWLEEQIQQTRKFYAQRYKTDEYSDPVALAKDLVGDEADTVVETEVDIQVVQGNPVPTDFTPEERVSYNRISTEYREPAPEAQGDQPVSPEALRAEEGESMEEFELRVQEQARKQVAAVLEKVGESALEGEGVSPVIRNVFETNGVDPLKPPSPANIMIISVVDFAANDVMHVQSTITWYAEDEVLADDQNTAISNVDEVIGGTTNLQFGNESEDPNIVYIRNLNMEVDFEVCLDEGSYAREVLGLSPDMVGKRKP